jgi:threonine synthase
VTIVGATSGDTGSAAMEAFRGLDAVSVFILYPHGRVGGAAPPDDHVTEDNAHASPSRHFDDCQARVKDMFNDFAFRDRVRLAGVNSINWARVLAQVVYYFTAAVALGAPHRPVSFCVPTGNFGDIFAGHIAKRMGLPIEKLIVATNQNDILHRALSTGDYMPDGVTPSISPSMDIQVSSNFERALFDAYGRDGGAVAQLMEELKAGGFHISQGALQALRAEFASGRASEAETSAMIARAKAGWGSFCARIPPSACMWRRAHGGRRRWSRWPPRIPRSSPTRWRPPPATGPTAAAHGGPDGPARAGDAGRKRPWRHRGADRGGRLRVSVELAHPVQRPAHRGGAHAGPAIGLLGLWVSARWRHERAEQNGIAHFLEHMAFKGTARRSALQIAEEIEDVGGYINAYTSREVTAYYARVLKDDVPLAWT